MDEAHIIYVNAKRQDNTELGRLMHDLHCKNAKDMYSKVLADRAYELKETKMGVEFMCHEMEKIYSEGIENGYRKGNCKGDRARNRTRNRTRRTEKGKRNSSLTCRDGASG